MVRNPYEWTQGEKYTVPALYDYLKSMKKCKENEHEMLCLGAVILTESIIIASPPKQLIHPSRLSAASDFEEYSSQPWGQLSYEILCHGIKKMSCNTWKRSNYDVKGFVWAITLWALSAVPILGELLLCILFTKFVI